MFLHLGNNVMVRKDKIIAIIDVETGSNNRITKSFINNQENKKIKIISEEAKEKSYIITDDCIYLSPISSSTLFKRSVNPVTEMEIEPSNVIHIA